MKRSELTEFAVEEEGFKLKIRRSGNGLPIVGVSRGSNPPFPSALESAPLSPAQTSTLTPPHFGPSTPDSAEADVIFIKSPMVGTFYQAPSPESKAFAEPGLKVVETTVVCIVEAMKIMNEIQAEVKGTILDVLVENGQPVEYGQKLFKVKKG